MDSTVLGDAVNLASRLEGLTKYYGASLLFSEQTYRSLENEESDLLLREVDRVLVKGRKQPVTIYELYNNDTSDLQAAKKGVQQKLPEVFELYRDQHWNEAETLLEELINTYPLDPLPTIYLDRCRQFREVPPPSDWGGVHVFIQK